jgi:hypothetical protein
MRCAVLQRVVQYAVLQCVVPCCNGLYALLFRRRTGLGRSIAVYALSNMQLLYRPSWLGQDRLAASTMRTQCCEHFSFAGLLWWRIYYSRASASFLFPWHFCIKSETLDVFIGV